MARWKAWLCRLPSAGHGDGAALVTAAGGTGLDLGDAARRPRSGAPTRPSRRATRRCRTTEHAIRSCLAAYPSGTRQASRDMRCDAICGATRVWRPWPRTRPAWARSPMDSWPRPAAGSSTPDRPSEAAGLSAERDIDCEGRWITPGLIDCHTHLVFAGDRAGEFELRLAGASYEDIAPGRRRHPLDRGRPRAPRARPTSSQSALPRLDAFIAEGVTTVEVKSGYGLSRRPKCASCARRAPWPAPSDARSRRRSSGPRPAAGVRRRSRGLYRPACAAR